MTEIKKYQNGFTLIELILYVSLVSIITVVVSALLLAILEVRVRNQTVAEVEQQGMETIQIITQTIRNAEGINSPTLGGSAASLSLDVLDPAKDPTIFDNNNGTIRIKEGGGTTINLTNNQVIVSNLNFQNLSRNNAPGIIRVSFILEHINSVGRSEYEYSKTFIASASLR